MTSTSIDLTKLNELIQALRQSKLPPKERRKLIEEFLTVIDVIKRVDVEGLVCIKHVLDIRGWRNRSSVYRSADRLKLHHFQVCCREFFSKEEIERAPKNTGKTGGVRKVRVGM